VECFERHYGLSEHIRRKMDALLATCDSINPLLYAVAPVGHHDLTVVFVYFVGQHMGKAG